MKHLLTKTKLVFLPLLLLGAAFIVCYNFLYWLLYIKFNVIPLKKEIIDLWIPMALSSLLVFIFIRPRVHMLKLDKDNGRIRTLYYLIGAAVFCIPTIIGMNLLDSATGKLTRLNTITEIKKLPATKYYTTNAYVLHKSYTGIESAISYSGKHNENLNFDIYVALPCIGELADTLQSSSAFLSVRYHKQLSSKISDAQRSSEWDQFWKESFEQFDKEPFRFQYLETMDNTDERDNLVLAVKKSGLYKEGSEIRILKPINEHFAMRNGNKLRNIGLSLAIGLLVWWIMILIPGLHVNKIKKYHRLKRGLLNKEIAGAIHVFKPTDGFMATPILISINSVVFLIMVFAGLGFVNFYSKDLLPIGALDLWDVKNGEWWRLLTSMFLHGGVFHLFMNMVSLYIAGIFLENTIGTKKFLAAYLLAGIAGGLLSLWWHTTPVVSVGASGAIFGLYGVLLALIILKVFDASINKALWILLASTAGYSLLMGFLREGIDNSAHVGGLLAGVIIGFIYSKQMLNAKYAEV